MMRDAQNTYEYYNPMPEHTIADLESDIPGHPGVHRVVLRHLKTGAVKTVEVSFCVILIGSRPDLRFLNNLAGSHPKSNGINSLPTYPLKLIENAEEEHGLMDELLPLKMSRLTKQLSWLKILCDKCRHINFCERMRRRDYKNITGTNNLAKCSCPVTLTPSLAASPTSQRTEEMVIGIGEDPKRPIDGKNNPIAVDKFTNHVVRAPKGLYAMGPLVGDNFVRFIPGGALAITSALNREND